MEICIIYIHKQTVNFMIGERHGWRKAQIFPFKLTTQNLHRVLRMDGKPVWGNPH